MLPEVAQWLQTVPEPYRDAAAELRATFRHNLSADWHETIESGMLSYVVPHRIYPPGYHCNPRQPLPCISIAVRATGISMYHMALYADPVLMDWFKQQWPLHTSSKPDIGRSCVRLKNPRQIPFALLGQLAQRLTPADWIQVYEARLKP